MADRTPAPTPDTTPPAPAADTTQKTVRLATLDHLTRFVVPNRDGDDLVVDHLGVSLPEKHADDVSKLAARHGVRLINLTEKD